MKMPRLEQPLFSKEHGDLYAKAAEDKLLFRLVTAYDCIWTLLYKPNDISLDAAVENARANLSNLGQIIETVLGEEVFQDHKQLSFPEEVLAYKPNQGVLE